MHHHITFQPLPAPGCTRLIQSAVTGLSPQGATVLITDQHDTRYSLLHQHSKAPHVLPNVRYDYYPCRCGCVHIAAKTTRTVCKGEMHLYNDRHVAATRTLLVQFDGSYKPRTKHGGAGTAAFLVDQHQMRLLDWQAIAIAGCPDNIYAETVACEQATLLAANGTPNLRLKVASVSSYKVTSSTLSNTSTIMHGCDMLGYSRFLLTSSKLHCTSYPTMSLPISRGKAIPSLTTLLGWVLTCTPSQWHRHTC